jgi:hypothetical protein
MPAEGRDSELVDEVLRDDIELLADVIEEAAKYPKHLTAQEVDEALQVKPLPGSPSAATRLLA